ncbi:uncharacterized protein LOC120624782 [Pararge aegeria]|uniref:uncharacterized protein LOC120624782 n=1 Tax=Pararge aegeria TaxID=116150 RepID=UPI0019D30409|nr:uncharacterized protein LOC120624782 [Pararge aegeria]
MSLCNTFRLSVACLIIVLSSIDAPVEAFSLRRTNIGINSDTDLAQEESVLQEVKRELNVSDDIKFTENKTRDTVTDNEKLTPTSTTVNIEEDIVTEPNSNDQTINIQQTEQTTVIERKSSVTATNAVSQTVTTSFILEDTTPISIDLDNITETESTTNIIDFSTSQKHIDESEQTEIQPVNIISDTNQTNIIGSDEKNTKRKQEVTKINGKDEIKELKPLPPIANKSRPIPKWKKYRTIERKRPSYSSEEKVKEKKKEIHKEDILKAETKNIRVTLQDTVTSNIPSLVSVKNDKEESTNTPLDLTSSISSSQVGHESKRAGFLNFSGKTTSSEVITESAILSTAKSNNNEALISETESPVTTVTNIVIEDQKKIESQIVLNEDTIKEELLKEELIKNQEENGKRQREDLVNVNADLIEIKNVNPDNSAETNSSSELYAKLINAEKSKNTTLYTVNPNYKPMKKIEVVPPKQFVRDPDDNSWRNESLSSLGIVFKPKNSSKPFTQVLKNKTETEWNNLSEKDIKNELPDLRERLQKMAEKRKSKRKKIDSFGNIIYFDYEENSSSAEHAGFTIDELSSSVTTYSPALQNTTQSMEGPQNVTKTVTSTLTTESIHKNSYSTKMPKKLFHEYYDSTDEDDSDYLNMAKIDLKKFTTSLRSNTPFHPSTIVAKQPDWLKQNNKLPYNGFPERKGTIQYFPPLTTQKVNINDYDNDFKLKMESFTTETDTPKHFLPVSIDGPTTPVTVNSVLSKSAFTKNMMITQPQLTTDPGLALHDDHSFDRGTYVIKHYKDFVNEAAKHSEYDKNFDYIPYTEAPIEGVTKTGFIGYEKETPRTIDSGYDYANQFRKDVLQRFVDNFNQDTERYRSDFPVLFNSSIIHRGEHNGRDTASSRAFMRGAYHSNIFKPKFAAHKKPCEPNCDKLTVELSPAYELHYYVPDQEEKEEAAPQPVTLPYQYTL